MNAATDAGSNHKRPTLTEAQAAERAGVSPFTMARERKRGRIAFHRVGGHLVRYSEADVDAYLGAARVPAKEETRKAS